MSHILLYLQKYANINKYSFRIKMNQVNNLFVVGQCSHFSLIVIFLESNLFNAVSGKKYEIIWWVTIKALIENSSCGGSCQHSYIGGCVMRFTSFNLIRVSICPLGNLNLYFDFYFFC